MKNALAAMVFSTTALIASMIIGDLTISMISIAVSMVKVARAYQVGRRYVMPTITTVRNLRPYHLRIMR